MAYVPGFRHDLFISYASDNYDARMDQFIQDLRAYIGPELGRLFTEQSIFFDRVQLNQTPTASKEHLRNSAGSAAILVPLLSQSYADSDYCMKELEWFLEDIPLRWDSSHGNEPVYRICPVEWRSLQAGTLQQLAPEIRAAQQQRSPNAEELGAKLVNALRLMRESRKAVYVGEADHDVRWRLRDELTRVGFRVMPEAPGAFLDAGQINQLLSDARIAVHFAGGQTENRVFDAIRSSLNECPGATIVYRIPGSELAPDEQLALDFIGDDIKQTSSASHDYQFVIGNFDQFLEIVRSKIEGLRPSRPTTVGIACEDTDRNSVAAIMPEIATRTGFSITCHGLGVLNYKKSRGVLFYWGAAQGSQLCRARNAAQGLHRAFFIAPPPKPIDNQRDLPDVKVLHQRGQRFEVEDIREFLQELGWRG